MAVEDPDIPRSWERLEPDQLRLYASELAELYRREKAARLELEAKNQELEQRLKELSSLNTLCQKHLEQCSDTEQWFRRLVEELGRVLEEARRHLDQPRGEAVSEE